MDYLGIAVAAAKKAGVVHRKYFEKDFDIKTKSSATDLLTIADVESEKAIVAFINERCPGYNFLAEEGKYDNTKSEYTWIIDPLDGTNNFAFRLPIFCTSIALARNDEVVVGVIYDAMRDEMFYAQKDEGAFLNGKKISVSSQEALSQALLITGFYYDRGQHMAETLANIQKFFDRGVIGIRRLGAAALDFCYVASGRATGFWEFILSPWDFAAGKIIVEEAGGKITGKSGQAIDPFKASYIVASNGRIHEEMVSVLR